MAIEYVGGKVFGFPGTSTSVTISLTDLTGGLASAPADGDLILVEYAVSSAADFDIGVETAGYTEIFELYADDTRDCNLSSSWKWASSDTSVDVSSPDGSFSNAGAVIIRVWRGVDPTTPFDVPHQTNTGTNSGLPNPSAILPSTAGSRVCVVGAGSGSGDWGLNVFTSSDLANFISIGGDDSRAVVIGGGDFDWVSGSFDPAQFGLSGPLADSTINANCSGVLVLRPDSGGGATAPTITTPTTASVDENATLSIDLTATGDPVDTWSISGGGDQAQFEISGTTLRWVGDGTQDFESPNDTDTNNEYIVEITATNSGGSDARTITVSVTDVVEIEPLKLAEFRGDTVVINPGTSYSAAVGLFADEVRNDGNVYSVNAATATATLPSTDLKDGYLIQAALEFEDNSNGRMNEKGQFVLSSGSGQFLTAKASGYNRDTSEDRSYIRVWCFIHNPSPGAEIQFQWKRDNDAPDGTSGVRFSQIQIIGLPYANIGMYLSTDANSPGQRTPQVLGSLATVHESDSASIERVGDEVRLKGDNKTYLVFGGQGWDALGNTRFIRWHGLIIDGTFDDTSKGYSYCRNGSNNNIGEIFSRPIRTGTSDVVLQHGCFSGYQVTPFPADGSDHTTSYSGSDPHHPLLVLELHPDAEVFYTTGNTQQSLLTAGSRVNVAVADATEFIDADSFVVNSATEIQVQDDADFLLGACLSGGYTTSSGARATISSVFRVNSTEYFYSTSGDYGRGNQGSIDTYGWGSSNLGFVAAAANDNVGVTAGKIVGGEPGVVSLFAGWVGFWGVNLATLNPSGSPGNITATVSATLQRIATSSSGVLSSEATSSVTLQRINTASSGLLPTQGSGSVTLQRITVDSQGEFANLGSASVALQRITTTASGSLSVEAVLGSTLQRITVSSQGGLSTEGVTTTTLARLTATAVGQLSIDGTGSTTLARLSVSGTGQLDIDGTSSYTLKRITVSSEGQFSQEGTASVTLKRIVTDSAGQNALEGAVGATLQRISTAVVGINTLEGGTLATLRRITTVSVGVLSNEGSSSTTLQRITVSSEGEFANLGTTNATLQRITANSQGILNTIGNASNSLQRITTISSGDLSVEGTSSSTLRRITTDAQGASANTGSLTATLKRITTDAQAQNSIEGTSSVVLGRITTNAQGSLSLQGTANNTLQRITVTSTADNTPNLEGSAAVTLQRITTSSQGALSIDGAGSVTLRRIATDAQGQLATSAALTATLKRVTTDADGINSLLGSATALLRRVTTVSTGELATEGTSSTTLRRVTVSATSAPIVRAPLKRVVTPTRGRNTVKAVAGARTLSPIKGGNVVTPVVASRSLKATAGSNQLKWTK